MRHERGVFDKLSEARAALAEAKSVADRAGAEGMLNRRWARSSRWPRRIRTSRPTSRSFQLQNRISDLENQIADRREFYNDTVTTYQHAASSRFPDRFVADLLTCVPAELFQVEAEDRRDVEINFQAA
jgi:LemA protein